MQTKVCKLCFKPIDDNSINSLLNNSYSLCFECYKKLEPQFINFKVDGYSALAVYAYDDELKSLIYQFKGCYDYELKDIFLDRFKTGLKFYFYDYVAVPVPSFIDDDKVREFNHVKEAFSNLKIPILNIIEKVKRVKQSDRHAEERKNIGEYLRLNSRDSLKGKKIVLVDDIYTTGSTIKACLKLIKQLNPKQIKILVLCKVTSVEHIGKPNNNKLY